ncbi:MAG TPA: ATP-dependent DNA helicase RecG, partial [Vicinamibacteria bacterium]|nr:ATP-dependent DNA helicase RecG [Vicinamibacteria bacterium]
VEMRGSGGLQLTNPQYEILDDEDGETIHTGRIVPVYEKAGSVTPKMQRRLVHDALQRLPPDLPDALPESVRGRLNLPSRYAALLATHFPPADVPLEDLNRFATPAQHRLIFEEAFLFQAGVAARRQALAAEHKTVVPRVDDRIRESARQVLPFRLTAGQKSALKEIVDDLQRPQPMNRLLQGDVGAGKTIVALLAALVAMENGLQVAFMAPTEILAEQHFLTFRRLLRRCDYRVELLTSLQKGREREEVLARIASGEAQIVIGTHALIQEAVAFRRLGYAVVDEQHRFGVLQREELRRKGYEADVLVMTATPIPRTLALTAYGDLDVSVVDEKPPGRTPVRTALRPASQRREVVELLRRAVAEGRQAYVVYPLVEESDKLEDVAAATEAAAEWTSLLPGVRVGLLHGRLKSADKEAAMAAFACGFTQVLVATTVIEVGVDVPSATLMVIEHAERYGLAQLHQLRGRVGRGAAESTCVLLAHGRLSEEARSRLEVMTATEDGFAIAERDLELRGPGDFFGTRQWGIPTLRVANLLRDRDLLERAREEALRLAEEGPLPPALAAFLEKGGWERRFSLSRVG